MTGIELLVAEAVRLRGREPSLPAVLDRWDTGLVYRPAKKRTPGMAAKHAESARRRWSEVRSSSEESA